MCSLSFLAIELFFFFCCRLNVNGDYSEDNTIIGMS